MELAILAALAYAGKQLSSKPKKREYAYVPSTGAQDGTIYHSNGSNAYSNPLGSTELLDEFHSQVNDHMQSEQTILSNQHGLVPYFRSEKSQNTNDDVKDRRLATFTGIDMVEYQHKTEVEAPFPTMPDLTHVYGTTFQPDTERYTSTLAHGSHNNVSPVEREYVGPGLGLSTDTVSHNQGFHPFFQVRPGNVNGYRKHNFGGRVIHGKERTDQRTAELQVDTNRRTNEPEVSYRGLMAPHASVAGPQQHGAQMLSDTNRSVFYGSTGVLGARGPDQTYVDSDPSRDHHRLFPTCVAGNPHGEHVGGRSGWTYAEAQLPLTERDTAHCVLLNAQGEGTGSYIHDATTMSRPTQRETASCEALNVTTVNKQMTNPDRDVYNARPTQKEQWVEPTRTFGNVFGGGGAVGPTQTDGYVIRPTERGQSSCQSGPAGASIPNATPYKNYTQGARQMDKRENVLVANYEQNPEHLTNLRLDPSDVHTTTHYKSDQTSNSILSNPSVDGVYNFTDRTHLGQYGYQDKVPEENQRDFGYAPMLLKTNPYAIDINQKYETS